MEILCCFVPWSVILPEVSFCTKREATYDGT